MASYGKGEARGWARARLVGVADVIEPRGGGSGLLNRMSWRYPTARIYRIHMAVLRGAQQAAGMNPTPDPDDSFFVGRCPA